MHRMASGLGGDVTAHIAARVRAGRAERDWTLDELAARSGVSRRLLVGIEQGRANPSLSTLLKVAAALGTSLSELLEEQSRERPLAVVRTGEAKTLWSTAAGSQARLLVSRGPLELWSWTLQPGERRASEPHRPHSLELVTVHSGRLTLEVGREVAELGADESAWFYPTFPHAYGNREASVARFALVVFEPALGTGPT